MVRRARVPRAVPLGCTGWRLHLSASLIASAGEEFKAFEAFEAFKGFKEFEEFKGFKEFEDTVGKSGRGTTARY